MRIVVSALAVLLACGGKSATPTTVTANPTVPMVQTPVAATTCIDAAAILRGPVNDPDAARAKENVIKTSCEADGWSAAMIKCVASRPKAEACLDTLDAKQRTAYDDRMLAWDDEHGYSDGEEGGEEGGVIGGVMGDHDDPPPPEDDEDYASCSDALVEVKTFPPAIKQAGADGDFVTATRRTALVEECDRAGWADDAKICMRDAGKGAMDPCIGKLDAAHKTRLSTKLGEIETIVKKTFDARKKPATIGCKQVVAVHYSDAKWKGKLDKLNPAVRKKAIDESRAKMTKACTDDKWDITLRACAVASDSPMCFTKATSWGFPGRGVIVPTGVVECDDYLAAIAKLKACPMMKDAAESMQDAIDMMVAQLMEMPDEARQAMKTGCKAGSDAIKQALSSAGC